MQEIVQLISTVGFPIVVSLIMFYYVRDQGDKNREDVKALNEAHKEELLTVIDAINNNTVALTELKDSLSNKEIVKHESAD
jgi:hypothetical protein